MVKEKKPVRITKKNRKRVGFQRRFKYKCLECGAVRSSRRLIREHIRLNHKVKGSKIPLRKRAYQDAKPIADYYKSIEIKD